MSARSLRPITNLVKTLDSVTLIGYFLKEGAVGGLSFGYRVREAKGAEPRELTDLELVEVSLVTFPMQPKARVHAVEESASRER